MSTVLFLDDERVNSDLITMMLEMDGFTVHAVPTIEQANKHLTSDVAALIVDCNLAQGVNGLDLARAIRAGQTAAQPDIVIIVTSGDDRREAEAKEVKADRFLLKPFSPSALSEDLQRLITEKAA